MRPQDELPGKVRVADDRLHARRERVFALFVTLYVAPAALLALLGVDPVFGASRPLRELGWEPAVALLLPLGVIAWPVAQLALALVVELYGRRRARALVVLGLVVWLGVLGLRWATDHVADFDGHTTRGFGPALALVGAGLVTSVIATELRPRLGRRRWLRHLVTAIVSTAVGWAAFATIVRTVPGAALAPLAGVSVDDQLLGVVAAASGCTLLGLIVGALPLAIAARALAVFLRIGRDDGDDPYPDPGRSDPAFAAAVPRRKAPAQIVDSPEEVAFFDAGERLASASASDSFRDLDPHRKR